VTRYEVIVSPNAEMEMAELVDWLSLYEDVDLQSWIKGLLEEINELETMPNRYPPAPEFDRDDTVMRKMVYREKYVIIYTVIETESKVWVTHVYHGSQNYIPQ